ncbi:MAG: glycosyltransferase family 2 protein [Flavobacterium sp.]|uniref:glycosyltransferase family 2 protein n=1 Tax=Flavobacterium sp. TaxID=239 RepID=UPI0026220CB5|nr:glycosyltransferase family 2 protein [Flavobacterium sp.]MDD5149119.1 glycosyltransferase family 2 protein [Flavobacterium sp.]
MKKITILIPCYNEEKGIGKVIDNIPTTELKKIGYDTEILVVDNNSKDKTSEVAKNHGARVIFEGKQGKTFALKTGFKNAKGSYIVTIDGDNTYPAQEISKLVKAINGNDLVVGSRFDTIWKISKLFYPKELVFRRVFANKVGAEMGSIILGKRITDVTTGLRLFKKDLLSRIPEIKAKGLDFEAELTARVISNGLNYKEVKIETNFREGHSSLQYFRDAFRFLWAMIRGRFF